MEILHIQLPDWSTLALLAYDIEHVLIACVGRFWPLRRLRCVRCVRCVRLETGLNVRTLWLHAEAQNCSDC